MLVRAFCSDAAPLGFTLPSYSLYPVLVEIQDGRAEVIELDRSMRLPVERIHASSARAFVLTSPNAPTGVGFANAELERALDGYRGLFVVDEAYAAFARENAVPLLARHRNLVVVRTLSKAYALAGIRVGYALADAAVIDVLDRVRDSYNVSRLSQVAALAAIEDDAYFESLVARVMATRDAFVGGPDATARLVHLRLAGELRVHGAGERARRDGTRRGRARRTSTSTRTRCWCGTSRAIRSPRRSCASASARTPRWRCCASTLDAWQAR